MGIRDRLFHILFLLRRPMTLGVRALAFDANGHVLLVRHTYTPGWHLCGGGVEVGETFGEALAKELREEANVVLGDEPQLLSLHFNRTASRRDHVAVYLCRNVVQTMPKARDREILEARFFSPDALPDDVKQGSRDRIAEYLNGTRPSALW